jgi:hypothetical protein
MKMKDLKNPDTVILDYKLFKETRILSRKVITSRGKKGPEFCYLNLATTALDDLWRLTEKEVTCLDIDEYALLKVTRINLHEIMRRVYQIEY